MHYELSIPWPLSPPVAFVGKGKGKAKAIEANDLVLRIEDRHRLEKTLDMAQHLGYGVVAYNLLLPPNCFDPATLKAYNPCKDAKPLFEDRDPRYSKRKADEGILQLSRVTVTYDESCISGQGNGRCFVSGNANVLADYDLISVLPTDASSFNHACLNLSAPTPTGVDIITFDLATSPKLPFQLKRSVLLQAISQGAVFEVCYGIAMRISSSAVPKDARRNVLSGARELIRVTGGKGIILSGNVLDCLELRGPIDLVNLGGLLGFRPDQARAALSENCRSVIMRSHSSRKAYRGAISQPVVLFDKERAEASRAGKQLPQRLPGGKRKARSDEESEADAMS